jgi:hypothetical protein
MEMYLFLDIACNAPLLCQQWQPKTARCFQMSAMSGEGKARTAPINSLEKNGGPTWTRTRDRPVMSRWL